MRSRRAGAAVGLAPLLLVVLLVGLAPFGSALYDSFFHDVYGDRSAAGTENYRLVLGDRGVWLSGAITAAWAGAHVAASLLLALPLASRISRKGPAGGILFAALLVPWAMPPYIAAALWRAIVHGGWGASLVSAVVRVRVDLLTSPVWAVAATLTASVWCSLPQTVFLIVAAMAATPSSLLDAARVDGASEHDIDRWVRVRAALPAVGAAAALDFLRACREVTVILLMTRGGPPLRGGITERGFVGATTTIEIYIYELFTRSRDTGLVAAAALLVALCMAALLGLYLAADRRPGRGSGGRRRRRPWGTRIPGARLGWASLSWLSAAFAVATSVVLAFSLVRLSFSGLSAAFFDSILPRFPTADTYRTVIVEEGLWRALLNTLLLSVPVALLSPLIALPAAGALWAGSVRAGRRARERGGSAMVLGAQLLGLTTGMHALVPLYLLFRRLGLIGSFVPVALIYTAHTIPFALLALRASLRSLPPSLADAARAEGMGSLRYLVRVIAPLAVPTLVVIGAVGFLSAWNGFLVPLVFLSDDARFPVSVKLFSLVGSIGSANPQWNLFAAGSVVNLVVVGALTLAVRRPMREGPLAEAGD